MSTTEQQKTRVLEIIDEMKPKDAHSFVNGPYATPKGSSYLPRWSAGWIDNWMEPGLGYIVADDDLEVMIRKLKKESRNRKHLKQQ